MTSIIEDPINRQIGLDEIKANRRRKILAELAKPEGELIVYPDGRVYRNDSHMQSLIANYYLAIPEENNTQLLTALRTAWAKELNLDKNVSVYNDLTDALRLALRAYSIK